LAEKLTAATAMVINVVTTEAPPTHPTKHPPPPNRQGDTMSISCHAGRGGVREQVHREGERASGEQRENESAREKPRDQRGTESSRKPF
jgi:hypothetical protein